MYNFGGYAPKGCGGTVDSVRSRGDVCSSVLDGRFCVWAMLADGDTRDAGIDDNTTRFRQALRLAGLK